MPRTTRTKGTEQRTQPTRSTRRDFHADEHPVGQDAPRHMKSTGPAEDALEAPTIEPVEGPVNWDKVNHEAFMEEEVTVQVHDTTDPNADPFPVVWVNGVSQYFLRGKEQPVKRKFVEVLARAKKTVFSQEMYKDAAGNDAYRQIPHTALTYPFSVTHDPNSNGHAWLKALLAEA